MGLSAQILIGLGLGILLGLFIGEYAKALDTVAIIYIRLMQMTVLPYLLTALIIGFGRLEKSEARRLALRGGLMLLLIWVVMIAVIFLMPMAFPEIVSASFFSSALVEPPREFSLAEICFTANPFESLSSNVVPILVERSKELFERHGLLNQQTDSAAEVMIPVLFNFPNAGRYNTASSATSETPKSNSWSSNTGSRISMENTQMSMLF